MSFNFLVELFSAGVRRRSPDSATLARTDHAPPRSLSGLSDRELRDIGYLRERVRVPLRHLMWM